MSRRRGDEGSRVRLRRKLERVRRTGKKPGGTPRDARPRLEAGGTLADAVIDGRGPR